MNNQAIFNTVWNHFVVNRGERSANDNSAFCLYRGPDGKKCAVGVLIPDELYSPHLEDLGSVEMVFADRPGLFEAIGISYDQLGLLTRLQSAHDAYRRETRHGESFTAYMTSELAEVARVYKLEVPTAA